MRNKPNQRAKTIVWLSVFLLVVGFLSWKTTVSHQLEAAAFDHDTVYVHNFTINGVPKRVTVAIDGFADQSAATVDAWKIDIAEWSEESWRQLEAEGFKSPANIRDSDDVELVPITLEEHADGTGGLASGDGTMKIITPGLGGESRNQTIQSVVDHEFFHFVQLRDGWRYPNSYIEGTAVLAQTYMDQSINQSSLVTSNQDSCKVIYLDHSEFNLWVRLKVNHERNLCSTMLWWRYFTQQVSEQPITEFDRGFDGLLDLVTHLEPEAGWRQSSIDDVQFTGDFDGNSVDDLLVTSDFYLGLLSPMYFNPTTLDVVADEGRFGDSWKYKTTDQVVAACNFMGARNDDFLIQSGTHIGVIGYENDAFVTLGAVAMDNRFGGGWLYQPSDEILTAGDFNNDGECEFIIKSDTHLGLIGHDGTEFETLAATAIGTRFGTGWLLSEAD
ncbi:MAG: hypothetical protein AAGD96_32610, partial [Chloroflexota bacterium]